MTPPKIPESSGSVSTSRSVRFALLLTSIAGFLDAYAMLTHGAFAAAQTGNLVLIVIGVVDGRVGAHANAILSVLAFVAGTTLAVRFDHAWRPRAAPGRHPLRWLLGAQAVVMFAIGLLPGSVPQGFVIVPLVVIAGMLFELFREADGHKFVPVTMTGNLVRLVEATYATFVERRTDARPGFWMDVGVLGCYLTGALLASCVVKVAGERSIWVAVAGMLVLLALFVVDDLREG